jgi:hypothetical protein
MLEGVGLTPLHSVQSRFRPSATVGFGREAPWCFASTPFRPFQFRSRHSQKVAAVLDGFPN